LQINALYINKMILSLVKATFLKQKSSLILRKGDLPKAKKDD